METSRLMRGAIEADVKPAPRATCARRSRR